MGRLLLLFMENLPGGRLFIATGFGFRVWGLGMKDRVEKETDMKSKLGLSRFYRPDMRASVLLLSNQRALPFIRGPHYVLFDSV